MASYRIRKAIETDVPVIFKFIKVRDYNFHKDLDIHRSRLGAFNGSKESGRISADRRERSVWLEMYCLLETQF